MERTIINGREHDFNEAGVCRSCGEKRREQVAGYCTGEPVAAPTPPVEPGIFAQGASLCSSLARWTAAGFPTRSAERQAEILTICRACPWLLDQDQPTQRCGKCGCPIHGPDGTLQPSKIAMGTESCPDTPPRWADEK